MSGCATIQAISQKLRTAAAQVRLADDVLERVFFFDFLCQFSFYQLINIHYASYRLMPYTLDTDSVIK
jgi:hypothetical protein